MSHFVSAGSCFALFFIAACGGGGGRGDSSSQADTGAMDVARSEAGVSDESGLDRTQDDVSNADAPTDAVPFTDAEVADREGADLVEPPAPEEWAAQVARLNLEQDLEFVAKPRFPGSDHWQDVQDLCAQRLEELGFTVERQTYSTGVNVVGTLQGTVHPEQVVVLSAHYDSVAACDGADDNASGVAGALEAARVLSSGSFEKTLIVGFWDEEEAGLIGSQYFAEQAHAHGMQVEQVYVFEMIAYKSDLPNSQTLPFGFEFLFPEESAEVKNNDMKGDFLAVIADTGSQNATSHMDALGDTFGLPVLVLDQPLADLLKPAMGDLQRSDHASFWQWGYSAMMITDTSEFRYKNYHCAGGPDSVEMLDLEFMTAVVSVTVGSAVAELVPAAMRVE